MFSWRIYCWGCRTGANKFLTVRTPTLSEVKINNPEITPQQVIDLRLKIFKDAPGYLRKRLYELTNNKGFKTNGSNFTTDFIESLPQNKLRIF